MTPGEQARITAIIRSVKNARRHTGPVQLSRNDFLGICDRIQSLEAEVARLREALLKTFRENHGDDPNEDAPILDNCFFCNSQLTTGADYAEDHEPFCIIREALGGGE